VGLLLRILVSALILGLPACASLRKPAATTARASVSIAAEEAVPSEWKQVASPEDVTRLAELPARWARARAEAAPRYAKALKAEAMLLDPQAALDRPEPTPGRYRCRTVRLGKAPREAAFAAFKPFFCFVATQAPLLAFSKGTGTHRPGGWLWTDTDKRLVFLGGFAEGSKGAPPPYRTGAATNAIGVIERIDDFRWRLVLAGPPATNRIEILELVPDTPAPTEAAQ
jgi:hypothetical protein